jgi:histidine ammonia-lyase
MNMASNILLNGNELTFEQVYRVALHGGAVGLSPASAERMKSSRAVVDQLLSSGAAAYGINTGFGKLASVRISPA